MSVELTCQLAASSSRELELYSMELIKFTPVQWCTGYIEPVSCSRAVSSEKNFTVTRFVYGGGEGEERTWSITEWA